MAKVKDLYVLGQWVSSVFLSLLFTSRCYCSSLCLLSLKICCFFIIILIKRAILQHLASFILKRGNATSFSDYVFETFTDKLIRYRTHTKTTQRKKITKCSSDMVNLTSIYRDFRSANEN